MRRSGALAMAAIAFGLAGLAAAAWPDRPGAWSLDTPCRIAEVRIGSGRILAETALTPEEAARGLMYRDRLEPGTGMLFVFPKSEPLGFWMRNTLIPLRIIYIDAGKVVSIAHGRPLDETTLHSDGPASLVLEVNEAEPVTASVSAGDPVSWTCRERRGRSPLR